MRLVGRRCSVEKVIDVLNLLITVWILEGILDAYLNNDPSRLEEGWRMGGRREERGRKEGGRGRMKYSAL